MTLLFEFQHQVALDWLGLLRGIYILNNGTINLVWSYHNFISDSLLFQLLYY